MIFRNLGKTGLKASIIGIGSEHLDNKPYEHIEEVIHAVLEKNINMMDLFMPGKEIRQNIGRALRGRRKQIMIQGAIGSVELREQYDVSRDLNTCKRYFDNLLSDLETDYIDFGMLFFIDTADALQQAIDNGIVDFALKLKKDGIIRQIGATSHNPLIARKMVEMDLLDTLMFSINPAFDMNSADETIESMINGIKDNRLLGVSQERAALYLLCEQKGIGITSMKTLGAGRLLSGETSPFQAPLSAGQCIHYALSRPAVSTVMLGLSNTNEVDEACGYLKLSEEEKDCSNVIQRSSNNMRGACVYCNHCQPCPASIDIASVNRYLDIARLKPSNIPPSIRQHYSSLTARGSDCIACGSCEERCPFGVEIIKSMSNAAQIFGS